MAAPPPGGLPRFVTQAFDAAKAAVRYGVTAIEGVQLIGFVLALILLAGILAASFVIGQLAFTSVTLPPVPPSPSPPLTAEALDHYKALLDRYKDLSDLQVGRFTQVYQTVVVATLFPAFTAILGYIFGRSKGP